MALNFYGSTLSDLQSGRNAYEEMLIQQEIADRQGLRDMMMRSQETRARQQEAQGARSLGWYQAQQDAALRGKDIDARRLDAEARRSMMAAEAAARAREAQGARSLGWYQAQQDAALRGKDIDARSLDAEARRSMMAAEAAARAREAAERATAADRTYGLLREQFVEKKAQTPQERDHALALERIKSDGRTGYFPRGIGSQDYVNMERIKGDIENSNRQGKSIIAALNARLDKAATPVPDWLRLSGSNILGWNSEKREAELAFKSALDSIFSNSDLLKLTTHPGVEFNPNTQRFEFIEEGMPAFDLPQGNPYQQPATTTATSIISGLMQMLAPRGTAPAPAAAPTGRGAPRGSPQGRGRVMKPAEARRVTGGR